MNSEGSLPLCCPQLDVQCVLITPSLSSEELLSLQRSTECLITFFDNAPTSNMRSLTVIIKLTEEHNPLRCLEEDSSCYILKSS